MMKILIQVYNGPQIEIPNATEEQFRAMRESGEKTSDSDYYFLDRPEQVGGKVKGAFDLCEEGDWINTSFLLMED